MPVRFTTTDGTPPSFLIPAPFVNINKTFDKQGDGEILGSRYTIQLDGWLVADRGSPTTDGTFITDGVDIIDPNTTVAGGPAPLTGWYESLQNKQKALSNLISKLEAGSFLEVLPLDNAMNGFSANVRLESVDLPSHDPGDPYKSKYTINLSCDYLLGPSGGTTSTLAEDKDDWERLEKWMISAASENYQIEEVERSSITRDSRTASTTKGEIDESNRVYSLTRITSATGKNKFDRENAPADGLEADGFTQKYVENGRAWQQARGYVYDIIKYGNQFIFGHDDKEHTYTPGHALPQGKTVPTNTTNDPDDYHLYSLNLPTSVGGSSPKPYKSFNYKRIPNIDVKGGSFSITETWILAPEATFATETVEISTQENQADSEIQVTINGTIEGVLDNADDVAVGAGANEDKSAGREDPVNENLNFDNLSGTSSIPPNKDTNSKYQNALHHWEKQVFPNLAITAEAIARLAAGTKTASLNTSATQKNVTHQPTQGIITYSTTFVASRGDSGNSGDKYIPYVISEDLSINDTYPGQTFAEQLVLGRRLGPVLQDIGTQTHWLREFTIQCKVNSSDPHICVDVEDEITGASTYNECVTGECEDPQYETKSECVAAGEVWTEAAGSCSDPTYTTETDCIANSKTWTNASNQWIANPNYAGIGTSNIARRNGENALFDSISTGQLFTTNMITSKPGYVLPGQTKALLGTLPGSAEKRFALAADGDDFNKAGILTGPANCPERAGTNDPELSNILCHWPKYKQFIAVKKLLNSLDPMTYIGSDYGDSLNISTSTGGDYHVTKRFTNAPSESWNPKTGDWSYSISWVYELNDPHTTFSSSFFNSGFIDQLHNPEDASKSTVELSRTAPGQYF